MVMRAAFGVWRLAHGVKFDVWGGRAHSQFYIFPANEYRPDMFYADLHDQTAPFGHLEYAFGRHNILRA